MARNKHRASNGGDIEKGSTSNEYTKPSFLSESAIIVLAVLLFLTITFISIAFGTHGELLASTVKDMSETVVTTIVVKGVVACVNTVYGSITVAIGKVYADFSVDKVVLFIFVACFLKSVPWALDGTMRMLAKPPKSENK